SSDVGSWFSWHQAPRLVRKDARSFHPTLSTGERVFLGMMRDTSMRLYEIVDAVPGVSLTLRDVLEDNQVTVRERLGSRSLTRYQWLAVRVAPRGVSGEPEIEAGVMHIPELLHENVRRQLTAHRDDFFRENPRADIRAFYKEMPPFFHAAWASATLDPVVPELRNTDGEETVITRVTFDVADAAALAKALDGNAELSRSGDSRWAWSGKSRRDEPVFLGQLDLASGALVLEANSVERGERGRRLVEALAGGAARHRSTTHEDLANKVRERLGKGKARKAPPSAEPEIPREVAEELAQNHYARYYRAWIDEPVPALGGRTPRDAAEIPELRPMLLELVHGLERMYQDALRQDIPAYDPSWMWSELGIEEHAAPAHPPPLAHERIAELVPGSGQLCRAVAELRRGQPGFDDAATVLSSEELRAHLDVQRFLREREARPPQPDDRVAASDRELPIWLRLVANFELHRRKVFWVDEALAFMLDHIDVVGRELRVPFPSFALVFPDRHVLSLAERLLAMGRTSPLAGYILRVLTVFVSETRDGETRTLEVSLAPDALGADLPDLVRYDIPLLDDAPVQAWLDRVAPRPSIMPVPPDNHPLRGLVRVLVNAILYATSAGVEAEVRDTPAAARRPRKPALKASSESVYFLPGAIEISQLRRMQALERIPDGRTILRRFMVRGHWRRAAANWTDRRMRWIAPYWKGPDMAAIVERTYKLKP
ncbi:MAG TPA: hypothetical protein VMK12_13130, partial [Anaeromyxobacteraceae bacterium]|nr:hypothetical protein [Anaeromyxobacteraceae bacterium]